MRTFPPAPVPRRRASIARQNAAHPPDWVEASVANSAQGLWVPGTYAEKANDDPAMRRQIRKQQRAIDAVTRNYGQFFSLNSVATTAGAIGQGMEKPMSMVSFSALRALSYSSQIDILIIGALKAAARRFGQICDVPGKQKGFRVVHRRWADSDFDSNTPDIRRRCAEMEELLSRPTSPPHPTFMDFLQNAIHEQLVIDRRCLVLPRDRGGTIASYHLIDGTTVKPVIEVLAPWMREHKVTNEDTARRSLQMDLWRNPPIDPRNGVPQDVDLSDAAYVQVLDGRVLTAWSAEEMYIGIANSTVAIDHAFYGTSPLESSIYLSLLFGRALRYNANLFDVTFPEAILSITGDYDEEGLEAFKRAALDFDPSESSTRLPIITGDEGVQASVIGLRDTPSDMKFPELLRMLANFKCAAYRVHPSLINVPDEGGPLIGSQSDAEIEQAVGDGFNGLMMEQANLLTNAIIKPRYDDLVVIIEGLEQENEQLRLEWLQTEKSYKTVNEIRVSQGLKELPDELPDKPGDFVDDSGYLQIYQILAEKAQQDMGKYEQGDFGQGADDAGQPWGAPAAQAAPGQDDKADSSNSSVESGWQDAQDAQDDTASRQPNPAKGEREVRKSEEMTIRISGSLAELAALVEDDGEWRW